MTYITSNDIKIKIKVVNSGYLLARATVTLFDVWIEKGWRVMKSKTIHPVFKEEVWIQAPCYKNDKGWQEIVFIDNEPIYKMVQQMIFDAYQIARIQKDTLDSSEDKPQPAAGWQGKQTYEKQY